MKAVSSAIIHILKILAFLSVPLFVYFFVVNTSLTGISAKVDIYSPSDEETNYLTTLSVYRGEGLYHNFSISYPPGRFIAQSLFFHILGPTVPAARVYMNLFAPLVFPTLLFFLTYRLLTRLLARSTSSSIFAYFLSWLALLGDLTLVNSAQEVHVFLAAFCLTLLSMSHHPRLRQLLLGALFGLIFLFRFEAGIITVFTLFLAYHAKPNKLSLLGFLLVWIPVLGDLLTRGSLTNFLYDTIILGLITQPRTMGQDIPDNALWYLFLASLVAVLGLVTSLWQRGDKPAKVIAAIALLSYVSALGRSDEGHLWYGLIWLPLLVSYAVSQLSRVRFVPTLIIGLTLFTLSYVIIMVKSPAFFLVIAALTLITCTRFAKFSRETAMASILTALLVFHSFQYLTLRFQMPRFLGSLANPSQAASPHAIAGLDFPTTTITTLSQIKAHITGDNPSLFIFPENTIYYEYFQLPRATRYLYLTGERTGKTESDIIRDLEQADNLYLLVFPEKATHRGGQVWDWIQSNTTIIHSTTMYTKEVDLHKKK